MSIDEVVKQESEGCPVAVLFELETVAVDGRKIVCDILTKEMKGTKISASRVCQELVHPAHEAAVQGLFDRLGVKGLSSADLAATFTARLMKADVKLEPGFEKLLKAFRKHGVVVGALSGLPEESAQLLMARLGLEASGVKLFTFKPSEKHFPRADFWLKMCKVLGKPFRAGVVMASSMMACKSVLAAGMRCIAIPDSCTACQDFSGVDVVVDKWEDVSVDEMARHFIENV